MSSGFLQQETIFVVPIISLCDAFCVQIKETSFSLLLLLQSLKIALHAVCAVLLHLLGNVAADVGREGGCSMSDMRNGLDIIAIVQVGGRGDTAQR